MVLSTHKRIYLPLLPDNWNQLSSGELEKVNSLMMKKWSELSFKEEVVADREFKLNCFLLFLGLKVVPQTMKDEDGGIVFLFRRKGVKYLFEKVPIRAWQVSQWINEKLKFLDKPYTRLIAPYGVIRLRMGLLKLKGPDTLMTDVTFHQYLSAQNLITAYWNRLEVIDSLSGKRENRKVVREQEKKLKEIRCRFLATLFSPSVKETGEIREGRYVRSSKRKVWAYSESQAERNAHYFHRLERRMFPVMLQFFQSVQEYYADMFPDLYTSSHSGRQTRNQIQVEVEMLNSVMKYQGFTDYDSIYDSEAVRILSIMNVMSKEAKEIERINQKYNKGK